MNAEADAIVTGGEGLVGAPLVSRAQLCAITDERAPCEVAILAGGFGTRLQARSGGLPKPMVPVQGRPALEHLVRLCAAHGLRRIALLVHFRHDVIREHFGDGSRFGVSITYCVEAQPRGTAGALCDALPQLACRILVMYGDTYADVDLRAIWDDHASSGAAATLLLHPNDHPQDSDLVSLGDDGRIDAMLACPRGDEVVARNLVNAALYVMETALIAPFLPVAGQADIAKSLFPTLIGQGLVLRGYLTPEYIKDLGTPERLDKVERAILDGLPERLSMRGPRRAVFIDRDGTLNEDVGHLRSPEQLCLLDGAATAVRSLNNAGWLAVGVTNQPVVARGDVDFRGLERIHARLDQLLGIEHAYLDRLYVCPHHPDRGYPGEVAALKGPCDCRKPAAGMIERAIRELHIDRDVSWIVGDSAADIGAGARAGVRTILVRTGRGAADATFDAEPDYVMPDLRAAVDWILHGHDAATDQLRTTLEAATRARLVLLDGAPNSGTSHAARVLQEMLRDVGRKAHVMSRDELWRSIGDRDTPIDAPANDGLTALLDALAPLFDSQRPQELRVPACGHRSREVATKLRHRIEAVDTLIVEGSPALLDELLVSRAVVRIHLDAGADAGHRGENDRAHSSARDASAAGNVSIHQFRIPGQ